VWRSSRDLAYGTSGRHTLGHIPRGEGGHIGILTFYLFVNIVGIFTFNNVGFAGFEYNINMAAHVLVKRRPYSFCHAEMAARGVFIGQVEHFDFNKVNDITIFCELTRHYLSRASSQ